MTVRGCILAAVWLALSLSAASARADYTSGLGAFRSGDFAAAFAEWHPLAEAGDAKSQHGLGLLYETGRGVAADPKAAVKWYEAAAKQRLAAAQNNLALLYAEGRGVVRNAYRAVDLWREAAESNYPMAQYNLGLAHYRGAGVNRNYREAVKWFTAAADRQGVDAQYALGECYRLGRGVKRDPDVARSWYMQAAKFGHTDAAARLSEVYGVSVQVTGMSEPGTITSLAPPATSEATLGDADAVPPAGEVYSVWLTSLRSSAATERSWRELVTAFPDQLGDLALTVRKVDLGSDKGVWYRLLGGPLDDQGVAEARCAAIKTRSPEQDCVVVKN